MSSRIRTPSLFRPRKSVDRAVLKESRALVEDFNRRGVLRGALTLGALTLLTGCDVSENESVQNGLRAVSSGYDGQLSKPVEPLALLATVARLAQLAA